jgi:hypothetical protein
LAIITTPTTPTSIKDSPILPSPEITTPTNTGTNPHRSPVAVSSPGLQTQLSNSSTGLKSILKQRSLSNQSSTSSLSSPTNERKSSTNYVSPLASHETRPALHITSTNNRSTSLDSTTKRTPPSTPTTEKKKSLNQQDNNNIFTNDIDERQTDEKKSTWRTPPTKQTVSNELNNMKKPTLDKIPKKSSATPATPKTVAVESTKSTVKGTKTTKQTSASTLGSKVPQLTLERIDPKSLKTAVESTGKSNNKPIKLKRPNFIQSDSDTEKKTKTTDVQRTKKSLLNNDITKRKQQHQQKPITTKKTQSNKTTNKTSTNPIRKQSTTETQSSTSSDVDEKKVEQTIMNSDHEQASSDDNDEKVKKQTKTTNKNKLKSTQNFANWSDLKQDTSMYDRIKKRARNEQTRNR